MARIARGPMNPHTQRHDNSLRTINGQIVQGNYPMAYQTTPRTNNNALPVQLVRAQVTAQKLAEMARSLIPGRQLLG